MLKSLKYHPQPWLHHTLHQTKRYQELSKVKWVIYTDDVRVILHNLEDDVLINTSKQYYDGGPGTTTKSIL